MIYLQANPTNLATAAEAYCKAGMAMADAEVSNWKTKYKYVQVRPITYIKANIDTGWTPLLEHHLILITLQATPLS